MAEVRLSRAVAEKPGRLPPVCIECGAPATTEIPRKFKSPRWEIPLGDEAIAILFVAIWVIYRIVISPNLKEIVVRMPVCQEHAGRFSRRQVEATSVTDETVTLDRVSAPFAQAVRERGMIFVPRSQRVRVRCRECGWPNDKGTTICKRCDEPL